jgi:hypothetical protein
MTAGHDDALANVPPTVQLLENSTHANNEVGFQKPPGHHYKAFTQQGQATVLWRRDNPQGQ